MKRSKSMRVISKRESLTKSIKQEARELSTDKRISEVNPPLPDLRTTLDENLDESLPNSPHADEKTDSRRNDKRRRRSSSDLSVFSQSECILVNEEENAERMKSSKATRSSVKSEPRDVFKDVFKDAVRDVGKKEPLTLDFYFRQRSNEGVSLMTNSSKHQTPTKRLRIHSEKENRQISSGGMGNLIG